MLFLNVYYYKEGKREDIINKRLTQETVQRQKDIEVRLLKVVPAHHA